MVKLTHKSLLALVELKITDEKKNLICYANKPGKSKSRKLMVIVIKINCDISLATPSVVNKGDSLVDSNSCVIDGNQ